MEDKNSRWISILVSAKTHKELTIIALDKGVSLGKFTTDFVTNFADYTTKKEQDDHQQS